MMTRRILLGTALLFLTAFAFGDSPGKGKEKHDWAALFKKIDTNGDGKISKDEFRKFIENLPDSKLKDKPELIDKLFQRLDADGDGFLSLEELQKWKEAPKKASGDKKP
jgi:Ca2+-binding EF-hand superfamily protein